MKTLRIIFLVILLLSGCRKSDDTTYIPPSNDVFVVPSTPDIAIYEINHRAFSTDGKLNSILPRLDSIKSLGINVIWLMPVHPIGKKNSVGQMGSPYSVQNYLEINPELGNLDDLKNLVSEAHKKGMAVILDWVANHTAWDNPWIANKDWYTQDGNGNIIHPPGTNWLDVADLNYDNAEMRQAMIAAMKYWIVSAGVDGYRCDAADFVPFDFWKQAIDSLKMIPERKLLLLAEGARIDHFTAGFQMNFSWSYLEKLKNIFRNHQTAGGLFATNQSENGVLPDSARKLRFTTNHDETAWNDTPLGVFGGKQASMAAFVLVSFMGGVPLIYNGQEVGCPVKLPLFTTSPIDWTTNPGMMKEYRSLMSSRQKSQALKRGAIESFPDDDVVVFKRIYENNPEVLVMVNTRNQIIDYPLPSSLLHSDWLNGLDQTQVNLGDTLKFQPWQYLILTKP